jgi:molybdopterin converting factor small subunit
MKLEFYGTYRLLVGRKTLEVETGADERLADVLRAAAARVPALGAEIFDENGNLFAYIPLYLNGRNPRLLPEGLDQVLHPADVLSIFSPISSGRMNVEALKNSE